MVVVGVATHFCCCCVCRSMFTFYVAADRVLCVSDMFVWRCMKLLFTRTDARGSRRVMWLARLVCECGVEQREKEPQF